MGLSCITKTSRLTSLKRTLTNQSLATQDSIDEHVFFGGRRVHICDFMTGDEFGQITVSSIHHSFNLRQLNSHGQERSDMDHDTPAGMLDR